MVITIVGIGLIGGSLAKSLRRLKYGTYFIGTDNNKEHSEIALKEGIVDIILPLDQAIIKSDLIILTTPVDTSCKLLIEILDLIKKDTIVIDMGSTKSSICKISLNHPKRKQFVASHPIAGTEFSGPQSSVDYLFENKKTIICDKELSSENALKVAVDMYNTLQMNIIYMDSKQHDRHIAYVSHISHISSFALGLTVLNIEKDEKNIFNMAGSGFSSTVRLAKSSPETWEAIFIQNTENVSFALSNYIQYLQQFKEYIDNKNSEKLLELMREANKVEKIINNKQ